MIPVGAGGGGKDTAAQIRALSQQLEELKAQIAWQQRDNEYRMDTMGMKRSWQTDFEGNIVADVPRTIDLYIPPETKVIQRAILRLRLLRYESYATIGDAEAHGEMLVETGYAYWEGTQEQTPQITEVEEGHSHYLYLQDHYHRAYLMAPPHSHSVINGVYPGQRASNVTVAINGNDVTAELGGPFTTDQDELDITPYIQPIGWNTITFGILSDEGRIRASLFVEIYLP